MKVLYYPDKTDNPNPENRIKKFIEHDLRKNWRKQWKELDFFLYEIRNKTLTQLDDELNRERLKKWEKRRIADLGEGLYEFRGKQSKECTVRLYFFTFDNSFFILDVEVKTDGKNAIEKARRRMKEIQDGN